MIKVLPASQFVSSVAQPQREESVPESAVPRTDVHQQNDGVPPRSQNLDSTVGSTQGNPEDTGPEVQDPLAGMSDIDRWGLKGFTHMMNNYPDYAALATGIDVASFNLPLSSPEYVCRLQIPQSRANFAQIDLRPSLLDLGQRATTACRA